jgi:hypothetical protein
MSARDTFHDAVRHALEKGGWIITHDPFMIRAEFGSMYIDLGAEMIVIGHRNKTVLLRMEQKFVA